MNKEQKELLLKDLCGRLPYGVKLGFYASATTQTYICTLLGLEPQEDEPVIAKTENGSFYMLADNVKPYLFPLSSMNKEQIKEFNSITQKCNTYTGKSILLSDFCNKHHIDWRGLIPMGLALDATDKNIYKIHPRKPLCL